VAQHVVFGDLQQPAGGLIDQHHPALGVGGQQGFRRHRQDVGHAVVPQAAPVLPLGLQGGVGLATAAQEAAQPGLQHGRNEGLGDKVRAAGFQGPGLGLRVGLPGDEHHRHRAQAGQGLQAFAQLQAVLVGHQDVQQDQVGWVRLGHPHGLLAIGGPAGAHAVQGAAQQLGDRIVIDDQQGGRARGGRRRRAVPGPHRHGQTSCPQLRPDAGDDLGGHRRLVDEVGGPQVQGRRLDAGIVVAGQEDDRDGERSGSPLRPLQTAKPSSPGISASSRIRSGAAHGPDARRPCR
jgi:hypothetical protein